MEAWVDYLGQWPWEWFCTLTFRGDAVHPESAGKRFGVWISKMNRQIYGCRWYKKGLGVTWVRALEMQRRDVIHYHALLRGMGLSEQRRLLWMDEWSELAGYARIEPPRSRSSVGRYCAKYVAKGGEIDIGGPGWSSEEESPHTTQWIHDELKDYILDAQSDLRSVDPDSMDDDEPYR